MDNIFLFVVYFIYTAIVAIYTKEALHMFQQNRYEIVRFRIWQKQNVTKTYPLYILVSWFFILILSLVFKSVEIRLFILITILGLHGINILNKNKYQTIIKPLVYTNRVKRQIFTFILVYVLFVIATIYMKDQYFIWIFMLFIFNLYQMHVVSLVGIINYPIETFFKNLYVAKAKSKLKANTSIKTIGITGSYGKTSSKNIINEILSKKYYCLMTPASFNTPLGISITLNDSLQSIHEVFICEMGADKVGEIEELFNFVQPNIGVVTSIGQQHLSTFKTQENIINEKMKMVEMMNEDGIVVLNKDEKYIREYPITSKAKQIWYGIDNKADYNAANIEFGKDGSKFDVEIDNQVYHFQTKLLGVHNIYNILLAIAIGIHFKISISDIQQAVKQLKYVENRLEIKKQKDFTIIDNAFNSNPISSKMSLDVLEKMPNQRICITPGLIDLGAKQDYYNKELGKYFINRCDIVILVGRKQTRAIYEGLEETNFNMKNVYVVNKIFDAFNVLARVKTKDCYVLLENDLPDAFNV